ncbi:serine kinase [Lacihabitans soyangensis]|uniref:Serine kinase n=2 Tax=Lacihabitans soyangensis TaxID=869394 RepID=A0AAE3KWI9_9BACT|nr:serine kinase [Lacihabitans soyangensis]
MPIYGLKMRYLQAKHILKRYSMLFKAYNLIIESDFDLKLPEVKGENPDIYFRKGEFSIENYKKTKIFRAGIQARVGLTEKEYFINWPEVCTFLAHNGKYIEYVKLQNNDDFFRLFAVSEALGLILQQQGFFLLHGSAVKIGNKATIFIGPPGAGKSTTVAAFAKAGYTVLSDDLTAIRIDENGIPSVMPAYPEVKIWQKSVVNLEIEMLSLEPSFEGNTKFLFRQNPELFPQIAVELSEIIILQKPYSKKKSEIPLVHIPIELLKYYPLPHQILQNESLKRHFDNALKIGRQVSVRRMNRPKNFEKLLTFVRNFE